MSRRRKIIIIVLAVAAIVGAVYYFFFYRGKESTPEAPTTRFGFLPEALNRLLGGSRPSPQPSLPKPISPEERLRQRLYRVSNEPAFVPAIAPSGNTVQYFTRANGMLWQADFEGLHQQRISDVPHQNMVEIVWSRSGDKAVFTVMDQTDAPRKYFYNVAEKKATELNKYIREVAFSPGGDKIVYHYLNTTNGDDIIAVANPDGSNFRTLFHPIFDDFLLSWPKEDAIVVQTKPSYASVTHLYALNARTGILTKILPQDYEGLDVTWSGDGSRLFASRTTSDGNMMHAIAGTLFQTQPRELFGIVTLAQKCVWRRDNATVICASPLEVPEDLQFPEDYFKGIFISADNVLQVNVETLASRTIIRSQETFPVLDAINPILAPDESRIFFVNRRDGYVYALRL
ncbi:MAG: hypothetical protein Q7S09_05725 [bacterium]|nr:hypothetical protein [bacterium]